jgi:hypothetical protein
MINYMWMYKGCLCRFRYNTKVIVSVILMAVAMHFPSLSAFSQGKENRIAFSDSASFLFSYHGQSTILPRFYKLNEKIFGPMDALIRHHRKDILSGKSHLAITSYICPGDLNNPFILNNASLQANVARSYIKVWDLIDEPYITFAFDTAHYTSYKVRVDYIPCPISKSANRHIYYTLKQDRKTIIFSLNRYNSIPLKKGLKIDKKEIRSDSVIKSDSILNNEIVVTEYKDALRSDSSEYAKVESVALEPKVLKSVYKKIGYPTLGIKTNLFYWAGIMPEVKQHFVTPNLELEYFFMDRWSFNVDGSFSYNTKNNDTQEVWIVSSLGVEPRCWLKPNGRYSGFYGGIYALYGAYDVKQNQISVDGYTGTFKEGGFSLGCYLPFSSRWGVEAGVRYGYRTTDIDIYTFCRTKTKDYFYYQSSTKKDGFQFTSFRLSVSYRFGKTITQINKQ